MLEKGEGREEGRGIWGNLGFPQRKVIISDPYPLISSSYS
jgi:hypothetical protein